VKKIKSSTIITVVIIVLILIIAGLVLRTFLERNRPLPTAAAGAVASAPQGSPSSPPAGTNGGQSKGNAQGGGQPVRVATAVRVTPVVKGTISNSILINGEVLAVNQVSIFPTVAGKIIDTFFQVGDRVSQGTVVATVDPSRPGQIYSASPVLSTIDGTILQAPVNKGDTVSTQTPVYVVGDLSNLMVETFVPERYSNVTKMGLSAQVVMEAFPGETFVATVAELSPVLDPASRTLRIRLRFSGRADPRIKAGMFATVSLVTNTHQDVPVIPRTAAVYSNGSWFVFTVTDNNEAARKEVSLGLESDSLFEVVKGVDLGDQIVSEGQNFLSDGDPVRIVE